MNESEENIPPLSLPAARIQALPNCKPKSDGCPSDKMHTALPHPTTTKVACVLKRTKFILNRIEKIYFVQDSLKNI